MMTSQYLLDCIKAIIITNQSALRIPIIHRSKFEGWLKVELANVLSHQHPDTEVEKYFKPKHIDISCSDCLIELKTVNSSFSVGGCEDKERPVKSSITSIIKDADKLQKILKNHPQYSAGFVAFVLFPISDKDYSSHINKINDVVSENRKSEVVCVDNFKVFLYVAQV